MSSKFEAFKHQIDDALALIEESGALQKRKIESLPELNELGDTNSLLERCDRVVESRSEEKPTIRIIHHLACSGGTLISKCIAAMPNVFLLSEVHPYTDKAINIAKNRFAPTDLVSLIKYADVPRQQELAGNIFRKTIDEAHRHVSKYGGQLVLRDHTHSDFSLISDPPEKSAIIELLEDDFKVISILTIRDPVDSYASLLRNGWVEFSPATFDGYCFRVNALIRQFSDNQIFRYEDFVHSPAREMTKICEALRIAYDENFESIFSAFKLSGDSGRSSNYIAYRQRNIDHEMVEEIKSSKQYQLVKQTGFY